MSPRPVHVSAVAPEGFAELCDRLGEILADAVRLGAGVGFLLPFDAQAGARYWRDRADEVASGARIVLVARDDEVVGTVSLVRAAMPNQPHRAEVAKLLVHPAHRRRGVATALVRAAEAHARSIGRTLLTLDCVAGGHEERFYRGLGYRVVGTIPGYALSPSGQLDAATFLVKDLAAG